MTTRCKMTCQSVTPREDASWDTQAGTSQKSTVYDADFYAVCDGSEENKAFWKSTPGGQIKLSTLRADHFVVGKTYYVDFTEAPTKPTVADVAAAQAVLDRAKDLTQTGPSVAEIRAAQEVLARAKR